MRVLFRPDEHLWHNSGGAQLGTDISVAIMNHPLFTLLVRSVLHGIYPFDHAFRGPRTV